MLNKFKPRYKTNKKIVDWEPTPDSKSRTMDRDKGKAGVDGNFWVKSLSDGRTGIAVNPSAASLPLDIVCNEDGDTFHLFRQHKDDTQKKLDYDHPFSWTIINSAADFCITRVNANGDKVWEKIYGFPSYMEDGAGIYKSPDHDGVTAQAWDDIFTYKLPEVFQGQYYGNTYQVKHEKYKVSSFVYVEGYLYACAQVYTATAGYDGNERREPYQQLYPQDYVQGVYVVKIDASNGEVVDDTYVHISQYNYNPINIDNPDPEVLPGTGLTFSYYNNNYPGNGLSASRKVSIFNYDPYKKKLVVVSKLGLRMVENGYLKEPHRNEWGTSVTEIDPDTMETTIRYLNYQVNNPVVAAHAKRMITFSPTHTYVVGRTERSIHPERVDSDGVRQRAYTQTAIFKFDKEWNLVDKKQYGYPEKDDQGNYFHTYQDWIQRNTENGYGLDLTQGNGGSQIGPIFYNESKDKIYSTSIYNWYSEQVIPVNETNHGNEFINKVSGDLNLSYAGYARITEIEPSDLSVTSVKWPQWNGPGATNQFPMNYLASTSVIDIGLGYDLFPTSMSPDGKYLYMVISNWGLASGPTEGSNYNQHHYFTSPWYQYWTTTADASEILRYNIETGEFDRSWMFAGMQFEFEEDLSRCSAHRAIRTPLQILATPNGWVGSWGNKDGNDIDFSLTVGSKSVDSTNPEAWIGLTDTSRGNLELPVYEGAMVYQSGDVVSTWTETPGFMTANENWMWDEPADWSSSYNREGSDFYTYYNSAQTLAQKEEYLDQHTFVHKIADLIGESHKAYDQDGHVDKVFEIENPGSKYSDTWLVNSYDKPFYRGSSEGLIKGGDGGFNDQVEVSKPFYAFLVYEGFNIDLDNQFSGSALLPPLPETDHHVFYSTNDNISWSHLPTADPDNGTLELVDSTRSGLLNWDRADPYERGSTFKTGPPFTHNTQTVYRYRAIFDWDGYSNRANQTWRDAEIVAVERFGLNSVTGKRNQIKTGKGAFEFVIPRAKDLMHYHGVSLILEDEFHKWDLAGPGFRTLDTSNLTDMSYMFYEYFVPPVSGPTLSTWDTSNVTDMSFMFTTPYIVNPIRYARLTIELLWDTSSVTNMESMLPPESYVDARTWDFSNVVNTNNFASEKSLILINRDITPPQIDSWGDRCYECRDINSYLQRCWPGLSGHTVLGYEECVYWFPSTYTVVVANREITQSDLPMYNSLNVPSDAQLELVDQYETLTRATRYVYKGIFPWNNSANNELFWLEDVIQFGGNKIEDGRVAFYSSPIKRISAFTNPNFTVSNLTDFSYMFRYCRNFNQDLTNWDTSNATEMYQMFGFCDVFNGDVTNFDVSNCDDIGGMFRECFAFNQDISGWNTQSATKGFQTFYRATSFNQDLSQWCVRGFASEPSSFSTGASSWTLPKPVWGTCPRNEDGLNQDFYHIFIANGNDINFPVSSDSEVRSVLVDDVEKDYATEVKGKIFNGSTIKAEFDWDNTGYWQLDWIDQILQFGQNSVTGKNNQIKTGLRAFYYANISESDAVKNLDISNLTSMSYMFYGNTSNGTLDLSGWDTSNITNMERMFSNSQCNFVGLGNWNTSNVTNMRYLAFNAPIFNADVGPWDVSSVDDFYYAFRGASSFNQDISGWNPSSASGMRYMFYGATSFDVDISGWDVSSVSNMYAMFQQASNFNQDISSWDTSNVSNMGYMFRDATSFNQDLSLWCVPRIGSEPSNFSTGATSWVLPKPAWGTCPALATTFVANTPTLTWDMLPTNDADNGSLALISDNGDGTWTFEADAFYDNSVVQKNLSWMVDVLEFKFDIWDNEAYSFNGSPATSITAISKSNIAARTRGADLSYTFANMPNFNQNISGWDVSATTNMNSMFSGAASFNQDLSAWNTLAVTSMEDMFNGATSFNQDLYPWCVSLIESEPSGFATGATSWTLPKPAWGTCPRNEDGSAPDEFYHIFVANGISVTFPVPSDDEVGVCFVDGVQKDYITEIKGKVLNGSTIKASFNWDNEEPEYGDYPHISLTWIQDLVQIGFNTETMSYNQIKNDAYAFYRMENVVQSDAIANLDVSNHTRLWNTFDRCYNLNQDLSGWDVSSITEMLGTFYRCSRFNQPIGSWDVSNVTSTRSMFSHATDFNQDLSGWDTSSMQDMYYMFGEAQSFNQDISPWDVSNVTSMRYMFYRAYAFNQDLSLWCVSQFDTMPTYFDNSATAWTEPRPVWGTCPRGEDGL